MNPREDDSIQRHMRSLDDHELLRLVAIEAGDYRPEALTIARIELERRRLNVQSRADYLAQFPQEQIGVDGFCQRCRSSTMDEPPGNTTTVNLVFGTRLTGHDDKCPTCGSVVQTKWVWIGIPIIPLGKYRVIWTGPAKGWLHVTQPYIGRRLRNLEDAQAANMARELRSELARKLPAFSKFLTDNNPILHAAWPGTQGKCALSVVFLGDRLQILFSISESTIQAKRDVLMRDGIHPAISAVGAILCAIEARRLVVDLHRNGLLSLRPTTTAAFREASMAPDSRTFRTLDWDGCRPDVPSNE